MSNKGFDSCVKMFKYESILSEKDSSYTVPLLVVEIRRFRVENVLEYLLKNPPEMMSLNYSVVIQNKWKTI